MGFGNWFSGKSSRFRELVKEAVSGGRLSQKKIAELEQARQELEADPAALDRTIIRREIFNTAVAAVKSTGQLDPDQERELARIQKYLALSDEQIDKTRKDLRRLRTVSEISQGNFPVVTPQNAALRGLATNPGEVVHLCVPAQLFERALGGDDPGVRVNRDSPYDSGSSRGHELPTKGAKDLGEGFSMLSNQRFIYKGGRVLAHALEKPEDFFIYQDGVRLAAGRLNLLFAFRAEGQTEIFGTLLTRLRE